ncbi:hypothetical protein [Salinisphaera aquimarina]|uniref:Uncharacterized protein n=1 Tax=Salinisphaera aquimarina TaxID=2094031 RepID=A0ABV7EMX0_9GAMM
MFNFIRRPLRRFTGRDEQLARAQDAHVQLRVPNPYGGAPWLTATVALTTTPHGQGETLRLRAHIDGCMSLPGSQTVHERLDQGSRDRRSLVRHGRDAAAGLVRRVVDRLPAERLAPLTSQRWRSWLDVQLSTSPLDGGADALMPERLRGIYGGGLPQAGTGEPRIGVWSGPAGGPAGGVAQLVMLQLDERDFGSQARAAGRSGFNLNASIAQIFEPHTGADEES